MKRSGGVVDGASTPRKRPRQDPVSCQSCRKRKLKCDRKTPCSGCSTRHLECIYHNSNPQSPAALPSLAQPFSEQAVDHVTSTGPQSVPGTTELDESVSRHPKDDSLETMDWLETTVMGHWIPSAVPVALRADIVRSEQTDASPGQGPMTFGEQLNTAAREHITLRQNPKDIDLQSYLPPKAEAFSLFRYYCDNLTSTSMLLFRIKSRNRLR